MKEKELTKELKELDILEKKVRQSLASAPKGKIRAELSKGKYPQYYYTSEDKEKSCRERYLRKEEKELAKSCVQREYDQLVLNEIIKRRKEISIILSQHEYSEIKEIYNRFSEAKRRLISPYILSDEEFLKNWIERNEQQNSISIQNPFVTEKGEIVRSKSEKMIADKLFIKGVNYKYEAGLKLNDRTTLFPDFTLLNIKNRKEYYLEHFGMMDNLEYCKKALEKIDTYANNNIYIGERLFVTFESNSKPINMNRIDEIIDICLA